MPRPSLAELDREVSDAATRSSPPGAGTRWPQLAAAVRAAERMPSARRKAAHKAVAAELDRIERELLRRLGV